MSRIGKSPIVLPEKVEVTLNQGEISIKGPLGVLTRELSPEVTVDRVDNRLELKPAHNSRQANAMSRFSHTARQLTPTGAISAQWGV